MLGYFKFVESKLDEQSFESAEGMHALLQWI
jgi:hypothetical protein